MSARPSLVGLEPEVYENGRGVPERPVFAHYTEGKSRTAPGPFVISLLLHVVAAGSIGALKLERVEPAPVRSDEVPSRIRIANRLYWVTRLPPERVETTPAKIALQLPGRPAAKQLPAAEAGETGLRSRPQPRAFTAPVQQAKPVEVVIVQPIAPANIQPQLPVNSPTTIVWTREMPRLKPKPFLEPGRSTPKVAVGEPQPVPDAPELIATEIKVVPDTVSKLPRVFLPPPPVPGKSPREGSTELPGDAVQVAVLSGTQASKLDEIVVPKVNTSSLPRAPGTGGTALADASVSKSSGGGSGVGGPISIASLIPESIRSVAGDAPVIRAVKPKTGSFDAVVVQSSAGDLFPEAKGLLRGRPIYTVYVPAGTKRDWVLQYCAPDQKQADEANTQVVRVDVAQPVAAPYPTLIFRPAAVAIPGERWIVVHGVVTREGKFDRLRMVRTIAAKQRDLLLACLRAWEFRPASRDGVSLDVEVLLAIPST